MKIVLALSAVISHRAELLDSFKSGVIEFRSQEISDVQVNVYGSVAVEIGKLVSRATRDGKDNGGTFRFTRVWDNRVAGLADRRVPRDASDPKDAVDGSRTGPIW